MRQDSTPSTVQIQEPTFKEIKKRHGWLKGSCATGCGCIVLFVGAIYLAIRFLVGNGPAVSAAFPTDFPKEIPQMNPDKIINITAVDAGEKQRAVWVATAIPRFVLSKILSEIDPHTRITETKDSLGRVAFTRTLERADYVRYLGLPPESEQTQTVVITWSGINNYPSLIADGLEKRLERSGIVVKDATDLNANEAAFTFQKDSLSGSFRAVDLHPDQPGTEFAELIVNYP